MAESKNSMDKIPKHVELGRYEFFNLANAWVKVIKRTDDGKGLTTAELIKKAMDDILSGDVTAEEIEKKSGKLKAAPPEVTEEVDNSDKIEKREAKKEGKKGKEKESK